jgi:signal transduction histidine kinase
MAIQIIFVSTTVGYIIYEESKMDFIGQHVNLVGKNSYLSELIIHKMTETAIDPNHYLEFKDAFNEANENISLLKNGAVINNKTVPPLPEKYQEDIDSLLFNLMLIEENAKLIKEMALNGTHILQIHIFQETNEYIVEENAVISNFLVTDLNQNYSQTIDYLMFLKIVFTVLNVAVYITTIFFMIIIIKKETKRISDYEKMETLEKVSGKLAHELRTSLTVIIATTQILDKLIDNTNEEIKERWNRLYTSLLGMDDKINELVDCLRSDEPNEEN